MARLCSYEFFSKYWLGIFGPTYAKTMNYISQRPSGGYMRSQVEVQKIADYASKVKNNLNQLGLLRTIGKSNKGDEKKIN